MAGKVIVKNNGNVVGGIAVRRPPYDVVSEEYEGIFPPKDSDADPVYFAYIYIDGEVGREHERDPYAYGNGCALRVSYALNMAGMLIPEKSPVLPVTKKGGKRILKGGNKYIPDGDKYYYIYSVENLISFLEFCWGKADKRIPVPKGISQLDTLKAMNKKGIIIFYISGYSDATGHATIWDGERCLDGSDYYEPSKHPKQTLTYIKFWELK